MNQTVHIMDAYGSPMFKVELNYDYIRALVLRQAVIERTVALDGWAGFSCTWSAFRELADEAAE